MDLPTSPSHPLRRDLGVYGATMMGLGSIIGTGVFVSIGLAAGIAGSAVVIAIALAAALAICNALNSAQLAANHPVSGGTYEYGYRWLTPALGFTAGWMFLCAKCASAATAALGFAGSLLAMLDQPARGDEGGAAGGLVPIAIAVTGALTIIVLLGIRRASATNILIVLITLGALIVFIIAGLPNVVHPGRTQFFPLFDDSHSSWDNFRGVAHATALMFVAYTGYGRIATLGEEVHDPRRTIPRAIILTLAVSALLYVAVSIVAVSAIGADGLAAATQRGAAPLEHAAQSFRWPQVHWLIAIGAMTAMLGVLLNLILGLSRVLLAMGRRGDMPAATARISNASRQPTPIVAIIIVGIVIAALAAIGSVKTTWSFSAFTVLIYYAITNAAALRLSRDERLYSPLIAWCGLGGCLFLAFWVEWQIWLTGLALIAIGLIARTSQQVNKSTSQQ